MKDCRLIWLKDFKHCATVARRFLSKSFPTATIHSLFMALSTLRHPKKSSCWDKEPEVLQSNSNLLAGHHKMAHLPPSQSPCADQSFEKTWTILGTQNFPECTVIHTDGRGCDDHDLQSWVEESLLWTRNNPAGCLPVPVISVEAIKYYRAGREASVEVVRAALPGLCVFVCPTRTFIKGMKRKCMYYHSSEICYDPALICKLAQSQFPKMIDTKQIRHFKMKGIRYDICQLSRQSAVQPTTTTEDDLCCICMEFPAQFKWKKCHHPNVTGTGALICLRCRNKWHQAEAVRRGIPYKHDWRPDTRCPYCQENRGPIVRWTR